LLGQPVVRVFPNDYMAVNQAVEEGKLLDPPPNWAKVLRILPPN
jgi:hypothetical protein